MYSWVEDQIMECPIHLLLQTVFRGETLTLITKTDVRVPINYEHLSRIPAVSKIIGVEIGWYAALSQMVSQDAAYQHENAHQLPFELS